MSCWLLHKAVNSKCRQSPSYEALQLLVQNCLETGEPCILMSYVQNTSHSFITQSLFIKDYHSVFHGIIDLESEKYFNKLKTKTTKNNDARIQIGFKDNHWTVI